MKKLIVFAALAVVCAVGLAQAAVEVPDGFQSEALNQDFGGGFDWLPNGDIIGMYADQNMLENSYIGIIDANGDGEPAALSKVYDFGYATFGGFVKVSPDGSFALFIDSMSYQIFAISLPDYDVTEVVPSSGSFDGAFDLAFIDDQNCYVSANPTWGTTNKILHVDLNGSKVVEIASIDDTFSGPLDVDYSGNLYYVKGKANYPPEAGDFTLLSFEAGKLQNALQGGSVLGLNDAEEIVANLDGGYDVAWHASGAVYVSDANNGKIYKIASVSDFATLSSGTGGGFTILAFRNRDQSFEANVLTGAELCAAYMDAHGGPTPPNVYRIAPVAPELGVAVDRIEYQAGDSLAVEVSIQRDIPIPFDGYIVFVGPGGIAYSCSGASFAKGIKPYVTAVPSLKQPYRIVLASLEIPQGTPSGNWSVYAAILKAGAAAKASNALAIESAGFVIE
jgi:hypothetical protein